MGESLSEGRVTVIPQDSDDLYILYNIIAPGDALRAKTTRKIKRDDHGSDSSDRLTVWLTIRVEKVEFQGFGESIRVRGKITETSEESVSIGSYHSLSIDLFKPVTIIKEHWTRGELERIKNAQMGKSLPLVVVAMDDEGALISQVGSHASRILVDLNPPIPRKGSDPVQHQKATLEFFKDLAKILLKLRNEGVAEYIIVGGPGFTKDAFYEFIKSQHRELLQKLTVVEANSSGRSGIREIITHRIPDGFIAGQSAKQQAAIVEQILEHLGKDTGLIAYGIDIERAVEMGAVEKLLVLDSLLHESIEMREKVQQLMQKVENIGGKVTILSSMHESGDIIKGLGGMVALLRFRLPSR